MPIYEYTCQDCGADSELLVSSGDSEIDCATCGSKNLQKKLSVPSSASGVGKPAAPLNSGGSCCGMNPGQAGCPGPGACCGHNVA